MSKKIPVASVYEALEKMLREKWGYIYGTAGVLWTESRQNTATDDMAKKYGSKWVGHMVTDCSGVMVYIWRQHGLTIPHGSSSMVRQGYIVDCGPTPHPGWAALVDKTPDTPDNDHIGIVGADGVTVYEARGTQSGFVTSKVTDKKWTKFGRFLDVDYSDEGDDPMPEPQGTHVSYRAEVTTTSGSLNMRKGPGKDYDRIGSVRKGTIVDVWTECDNGWRYIDDDGGTGYVDGRYLTKVEETTSSGADAPPSLAGQHPGSSGAGSTPEGKAEPAQAVNFPEGAAGTVTRLRRADGTEIWIAGVWEVDHIIGGDD